MSEIRKARLRATYAREIALFPPGAANLPLAQRFLAAPITLSGPDGAVNVALRPSSTHIALGHEYSPEPTPCPTPCLSTYAHGQADVRATLRGATAALEALVRGTVDEEWLNAPALKSKPLSAPWMTRSYAQREDPLMAPRMATRSPARIGGFKVDNVRGMGTPSGLRAAYSSGSTESELSDIHENIPQDVAAWFAAINERKE
ncbi:hypothetical protein FRC08_008120 [Ceratobasidium sp. 394]|nr:hypothetical protein FRC08_008120 [Ceratobasidium sp. 394]